MKSNKQGWIGVQWAKRVGVCALLLYGLMGCASTPPKPAKDSSQEIKRLSAACMAASGSQTLEAMLIPKAATGVANQLVVAYSAVFDSPLVDNLTKMLDNPKREVVLVASGNDAVAAAILKRALSKLEPKPPGERAPVCLAADERYQAEVKEAGERVGVAVFGVQ